MMFTTVLLATSITSCDEQPEEDVYHEYADDDSGEFEEEDYDEEFVLDENFLYEDEVEYLDPPPPELASVDPQGDVISDNEWERITDGVSYERTEKKKPEPRETSDFNPGINFGKGLEEGFSVLVWILVIVLIVGLLAWLIIRTKVDNSVGAVRDFSVTDELLAASKEELADALTQNLNAKDYRAAIRYRFGQILQAMRKEGLLVWVPGRTNAEYQEQLEEPYKEPFGVLAKAFSFAMYSGREVSLKNYDDFSYNADAFLASFSSLSRSNTGLKSKQR